MIPTELTELRQWVVAGADKVPLCPTTLARANVKDPTTWGTFEEAVATGMSVGFVLTEADPYTFIDLDAAYCKACDSTGCEHAAAITRRHQQIYEAFPSYAELSRSGQGVHIIVRGSVPHGAKRDKVEVYSNQRYMICTGNTLRDVQIISCQEMLDHLWNEINPNGNGTAELVEHDAIVDDAEVWRMASDAVNGEKFDKLADGDWQDDYSSQSEADFALLAIIAFYTRSNEQVKRIFRTTQLGMRAKAQREEYLDTCLRKIRAHEPEPIDFSAFLQNYNPFKQVGNGNGPETASGGHPGGGGTVLRDHGIDGGTGHDRLHSDMALHSDQGGLNGNAGSGDDVVREGESSGPAVDRAQPVPHATAVHRPSNLDRGAHIDYPPGFVGFMARYITETSARPVPEVGIAAALSLCSGILGRQFNISGTGLNLYIILLAKTGVGKEGGPQGIDRVISAVRQTVPLVDGFVGPGSIASGQGLIRWLDEHPSFVSVLGEFGLTLQVLSAPDANANSTNMRRVLLDLYSKSGYGQVLRPSAYSDQTKNTNTVHSPAVTLLGESTPETFYAGLSVAHIADGLIPRFLLLEYEGDRPDRNLTPFAPPPLNMVQHVANLAAMSLTMAANNSIQPVFLSTAAEAVLTRFDSFCDEHIRAGNSEGVRQLWNRAHLKALRLCGVLVAADRPHNPEVNEAEAQWAVELVRRDAERLVRRFDLGDIGEGEAKQNADLERVLADYFARPWEELEAYGGTQKMRAAGLVPHVFLQRRTANLSAFRRHKLGARAALRDAVEDMIRADLLQLVPSKQMKETFGSGQLAYKVKDR